jgi:hypothetical protein
MSYQEVTVHATSGGIYLVSLLADFTFVTVRGEEAGSYTVVFPPDSAGKGGGVSNLSAAAVVAQFGAMAAPVLRGADLMASNDGQRWHLTNLSFIRFLTAGEWFAVPALVATTYVQIQSDATTGACDVYWPHGPPAEEIVAQVDTTRIPRGFLVRIHYNGSRDIIPAGRGYFDARWNPLTREWLVGHAGQIQQGVSLGK